MWEVHLERIAPGAKTAKDTEARIEGFLKRPNATEVVLRKDGELVGCAFSFEESEGEIKKEIPYANLFAKPKTRVFQIKGVNIRRNHRGQGLGQMITEKIMEETKKKGATKIVLSTFPEKDNPAPNLYQKLGFQEVAPNQDPKSFYMVYEYVENEDSN